MGERDAELAVECPKCHVAAGHQCRTVSGRVLRPNLTALAVTLPAWIWVASAHVAARR